MTVDIRGQCNANDKVLVFFLNNDFFPIVGNNFLNYVLNVYFYQLVILK